MKHYPCKIDMFIIENMAFSRRCSFPSLSRWRSALRELQKSSIRSSRAESGEGNLVVDPKLPWTMSDFFQWFGDLDYFLSWDNLALIFFSRFWWMLSNDFFSNDLLLAMCVSGGTTPPTWTVQSWESAFKKNNTKFIKLSATFGSLRLKKKSLMKRFIDSLLLKMRPAEC